MSGEHVADFSDAAICTKPDGEPLQRKGRPGAIPQELFQSIDAQTHARNFFDCVKSRKPTITNQDVMLSSHTACFAAALSWILGRKLAFDPSKREFIGDDEANSLRVRPERQWA